VSIHSCIWARLPLLCIPDTWASVELLKCRSRGLYSISDKARQGFRRGILGLSCSTDICTLLKLGHKRHIFCLFRKVAIRLNCLRCQAACSSPSTAELHLLGYKPTSHTRVHQDIHFHQLVLRFHNHSDTILLCYGGPSR
jgi:hypothetical protein